jgi:predicted nuclease of restriction endonuclease-like (RecB) superfamily
LAWSEPILARAVRELRIIQPLATESAILKRPISELNSAQVPRPVSDIPWGQNIDLFQKVKDPGIRLWYAQKAFENGWSRPVLAHHIDSGLHNRQGKALTNFRSTLPPELAERAQEIMKDTYNLDFIALEPNARERDLELGMIANVSRTLLEFGAGFAFVGRQVPLSVGGRDYCLDLLFYNLELRCYFVIELKAGEFKPEHVGKLGFYLSAVDDTRRHKDDQPSIGMIICRSKDRLTVEYALRNSQKPIGVATYTFTKSLPKDLRGKLPSAEAIEAALGGRNA